jgi:hypothetical protein
MNDLLKVQVFQGGHELAEQVPSALLRQRRALPAHTGWHRNAWGTGRWQPPPPNSARGKESGEHSGRHTPEKGNRSQNPYLESGITAPPSTNSEIMYSLSCDTSYAPACHVPHHPHAWGHDSAIARAGRRVCARRLCRTERLHEGGGRTPRSRAVTIIERRHPVTARLNIAPGLGRQ